MLAMGSSSSSEHSKEEQCRTEIKVTNFTYKWVIKNYMDCRKTTGQYLESTRFETVDDGNSKWCLRIYPKGDKVENANYVSLFLKLISSGNAEVSTKFAFSLVDEDGKETNTVTLEHKFTKSSDQCGQPRYVERMTPPAEIRDILHNNEVKISCALSIVGTETTVEECKSPILEIPPFRLSEDMEKLFENKELCDFTVSCGGKELHCHKAVLAARSPVFLNMLRNDTRESRDNRVNVWDIDENTIEALLRFLYTGKSPPKERLTKELLIASDKYDVQRLKLMCEEALSSTLSVDSAVGLLIIADNYHAEKLKTHTLQFIVKNIKGVMGTKEWKEISHEHHSLFVEVSQCVNSS